MADKNFSVVPIIRQNLPGIGALAKQAWEILEGYWLKFIGLMLIPLLCLIAGVGVSLLLVVLKLSDLAFVVIFLASLVTAIVAFVSSYAALYLIAGLNYDIKVVTAYKQAFPKFFRIMWINLLVSLAVNFGMIFFIIPGIIFAVWFLFAVPVAVYENLGGTAALSRSRLLVKGQWWPVAWRYLGFILLLSIFPIVMTGIGASAKVLALPGLLSDIITFGSLLADIIYTVIFLPIFFVFHYLLYYHLRMQE
jgi:hypothetical protein